MTRPTLSLIKFSLPLLLLATAACDPLYPIIRDDTYVRRIESFAPIDLPPPHLTGSESGRKAITLSPHFTLNGSTALRGRIHNNPADVSFSPTDAPVSLAAPRLSYGVDVDYTAGGATAFTFGVNNSSAGGHATLNALAGIGLMGHGKRVSMRVDLGVQFSRSVYDAESDVTTYTSDATSSSTVVRTFADHNESWSANRYVNLTINSHPRGRLPGLLVQLGTANQTFAHFNPTHQVAGNSPIGFRKYPGYDGVLTWVYVTPGVYYNTGKSGRVVLGVRAAQAGGIEGIAPKWVTSPTLRFDWTR